MALLHELNADGATILVITHDEGIAATLPRRIALRDGVVEADTGARWRWRGERVARRAGCRPPTCCAPAPSACARGGCAPRSPRWASPSGSPRWSPCSASRSPPAPTCSRRSTGWARTCSRSRPASRSWARTSSLPESAAPMLARAAGVEAVAAVRALDGVTVRRTDLIDEVETGGIAVGRRGSGAAATVGAEVRDGRFLDAALARYPVVVLGANAADQLGHRRRPARGCSSAAAGSPSRASSRRSALAPSLDDSALVGFDAAERWLGGERDASTVYVRAAPDAVERTRDLLGATANPERPEEVDVSRPSDALEARAAAKTAFTSLFLGLGAVALLVGGVGIANVMVISVLERRSEVGLRRALGARRRHVGAQFLCESLLLAAAGGAFGVALGAAVTAGYAASQDWRLVVPPEALARRARRGGRDRRGGGLLPGAAGRAAGADGRAAGDLALAGTRRRRSAQRRAATPRSRSRGRGRCPPRCGGARRPARSTSSVLPAIRWSS